MAWSKAREVAGGLPRTFWVLWTGLLINRIGWMVLPFMSIYLTRVRGTSMATAGMVVACYGAGAAFSSAIGGYLADHWGRRSTMVAALTLGGCGVIALGFAHDVAVFAPACFFIALVAEGYRPAMQATVTDVVPPADRVRAFGLIYWVINFGVSIGLSLGGWLATRSFKLLFFGDGITSIIFGLLVWRLVPESKHLATGGATHAKGSSGGFFAPYRDKPFLAFVLLSIALLLVFMQHLTTLPMAMAKSGLPSSHIGIVLALNGIVIVFVQPLLAPWLARYDHSRVIAAGAALLGLGFGLNAFAHTAIVYGIGVTVWTVGEICILPIGNAVVADVAKPDMRGRYQGAYGLSFGTAALISPIVGSIVLQHFGAAALWGASLVIGLGVAAGQLALGPKLRRLTAERRAAA